MRIRKFDKKIRGEMFRRSQRLTKNSVNVEDRTAEFTFSSELPVDRFFGKEILDHSPESIRTERLSGGANLLLDHDGEKVIGVIEDFSIDSKAGKASVRVRFSRNDKGEEVLKDVIDGIRKNVSVGYAVHDEDPEGTKDEESGDMTWRFMDWEPLEVSFVGVPADHTVGVGRSKDKNKRRNNDMEKCKVCGKEHATLDNRGICPGCIEEITRQAAPAPAAPAARAADSSATPEELEAIRVEAAGSAKKTESERVREIYSIGEQFGMQEQARKAVDEDVPLDEFRKDALELVRKNSKPGMVTSDDLGMNGREKEDYSLCRAILHMTGEKDYAKCFERDIHDEISKKHAARGAGIMIPSDQVVPRSFALERAMLMARTTMIAGTDSLGGYLVGTDHRADMFLDFLRAKTVLGEMGAQIMEGLVGNIEWPTQATDPTINWLATEAGALTESNLTFGQNTMSPKIATIKQSWSRQLLRQSNPSIENVVRNSFLNKFATEVDRVGITGASASNEPVGILNTSGIGAVAMGTDGGALTWGGVIDLESEVAIDNADMGALGYITNPKVRGSAKQTLKDAAVSGYIWSDMSPGAPLNGFRAGVTTNVPSNLTKGSGTDLSALIYGNFNDAIYGFWGALEIEEDRITNADSGGGIVLRLFHYLDFIANRAQSFSAMKDIVTT